MKQCKLKIHQSNFSDEPLVFNATDFPDVLLNDLLKIYHCNHLPDSFVLIQVKSIKEDDRLPKDTISIDKALAAAFNLQVFHDVYVMRADPDEVTIDLLEVSFKDQYISRSDMWRMKKHLQNSCVYIDWKVNFCGIRAQVSELWANADKVRCGYISDSTNFVLRSSTAKVYVFIQMSREMWQYDAYGYLQFERAVDGFLRELFTKWKEKKCCHELTLVLFSRRFYHASDIKEFPESVQKVVRRDYSGKFYMDFYKCVVQMGRIEDCTPLITTLKKLFHKYDEITDIPGCPKSKNSMAAQGNFLEAINMSLNVFERHNNDRNFDRTGQIVVCITPGVGVFDVDRDLTILTKERMIDNGIGSDLICLGQQPLHAVPLFKFQYSNQKEWDNEAPWVANNDENFHQNNPDFNIPHWINHSFYTSNPFPDEGTTNITYIPRIQIPPLLPDKISSIKLPNEYTRNPEKTVEPKDLPIIPLTDYEDYDKQIFACNVNAVPNWKQTRSDSALKGLTKMKNKQSRTRNLSDDWKQTRTLSDEDLRRAAITSPVHIPGSKPHLLRRQNEGIARSMGAVVNDKVVKPTKDENLGLRFVVGSAGSSQAMMNDRLMNSRRRALFNPFNPLHMFAPLTANRRRWVHTYPRGPQGEALVMHHQNVASYRDRKTSDSTLGDDSSTLHGSNMNSPTRYSSSPYIGFSTEHALPNCSPLSASYSSVTSSNASKSCGSDELDLSPADGFALGKGLDWKSLKCPACLPITTDYCPTASHLANSCVDYSYSIVPDDAPCDTSSSDEHIRVKTETVEPRNAREIFLELVNQRLCQGFQIIKQMKRTRNQDSTSSGATLVSPSQSENSFRDPQFFSLIGNMEFDSATDMYMLSHGRQYHVVKLSRTKELIEVKIYKPKHPFVTVSLDYYYMLWPQTRSKFQTARSSFSHEKVEYNYWNFFDDYVCDQIDYNIRPCRDIKCWKAKFMVLPSPIKQLNYVKTLKSKDEEGFHYDVFEGCLCEAGHEKDNECTTMLSGFVRFVEQMNKMKRTSQNSRRSWSMSKTSSSSLHTPLGKSFSSQPILSLQHSNPSTPVPHSRATSTPTPTSRPNSSTPSSDRSTPAKNLGESFVLDANVLNKSLAEPLPIFNKGEWMVDDKTSTPRKPTATYATQQLNEDSEYREIVNAMKNEETGLYFLPEKRGLPQHSFTSLEAVHWALGNIAGLHDDIVKTCQLFENMRKHKLISHASYDSNHPFIYGSIFYCILPSSAAFELEDPTSYQYTNMPSQNNPFKTFQNFWFEVAVQRKELELKESENNPTFPTHKGKSGAFFVTPAKEKIREFFQPKYKTVRVPLRNRQQTQRSEWCDVSYSTQTSVGSNTLVFCFQLQWMVATATCLFNMLQLWWREAPRCDLFLFPVPSDPFSFPRSGASGPLRSPLFVSLNLKSLSHSSNFQGFLKNPVEFRKLILKLMQKIVTRFGFLRDSCAEVSSRNQSSDTTSQCYVHFTGRVFAQIPLRHAAVQRHSISYKQKPAKGSKLSSDAPQQFITASELENTGFYWSANYMLTKRWRLSAFDEFKISDFENDFVSFCDNESGRLLAYFNEISGV